MLPPHEKDARLLYCSLVDRRCFRGENLNPTKTSQMRLPESTTQPLVHATPVATFGVRLQGRSTVKLFLQCGSNFLQHLQIIWVNITNITAAGLNSSHTWNINHNKQLFTRPVSQVCVESHLTSYIIWVCSLPEKATPGFFLSDVMFRFSSPWMQCDPPSSVCYHNVRRGFAQLVFRVCFPETSGRKRSSLSGARWWEGLVLGSNRAFYSVSALQLIWPHCRM